MRLTNLCLEIFSLENDFFHFQTNRKNILSSSFVEKLSKPPQIFSSIDSLTTQLSGFYLLVRSKFTEEVFLIRDHLGIQPIYYLKEKEKFIFSDRVDQLIQYSKQNFEFDWKNAFVYFGLNKNSSHSSFFKGIELVPPASMLYLNQSNVEIKKYWTPTRNKGEFSSLNQSSSIDEIANLYLHLIQENVKKISTDHKKITLGFSGGLDSTLLAALLKDQCELQTWSIAAPYFYQNGDIDNVLKITKQFQLKNTILPIDLNRLSIHSEDWINAVCQAEHPYFNSVFYLKTILNESIQQSDSKQHTMVSGFGSDQFNGGNSSGIIASFAANVHDHEEEQYLDALRFINDQNQYLPEVVNGLGAMSRYIKTDFLSNTTKSIYCWDNWIHHQAQFLSNLDLSIEYKLHRGQSLHFPFLDKRMIELVVNTAPHLISKLFLDKAILRHGAKQFVPKFISEKPKNAHQQNFALENYGILKILAANNFEFVKTLFDTPHEVVNVDRLMTDLQFMFQHKNMARFRTVITIINCRILEKHLGKTTSSPQIFEHNEFQALDTQQLNQATIEKTLQNLFAPQEEKPKPSLSKKDILHWKDHVNLSIDIHSNHLYIMNGFEAAYEISEENKILKECLLSIDGKKPLADIFDEKPITEELWENIIALVEEGFLSS